MKIDILPNGIYNNSGQGAAGKRMIPETAKNEINISAQKDSLLPSSTHLSKQISTSPQSFKGREQPQTLLQVPDSHSPKTSARSYCPSQPLGIRIYQKDISVQDEEKMDFLQRELEGSKLQQSTKVSLRLIVTQKLREKDPKCSGLYLKALEQYESFKMGFI